MPKQPKSKGGRPKAPEPLKSILSLKGTPSFERWLDGLVEHARLGTRTLLLRNAIEDFAKAQGYGEPMPKR